MLKNQMMKVLVDISDSEMLFGMKVLQSLSFIKKAKPMTMVPLTFGKTLKMLHKKCVCINREN